MCLALPALVVELRDGDEAVVDLDGVRKCISLALVEDVQVGDYLIVHVGFALQKLDIEEAEATLSLFRDLRRAEAEADAGADAATALGAQP
ncbi:MAG: HypC/HybG/HupF family hydrogenase formation chaperone [Leptothrix sp. (in: b-proteobacteria)]